MATVRLSVNGKARSVETEPERPLLEVLREDLGLTGTKHRAEFQRFRTATDTGILFASAITRPRD
jgi:aerobic-type carbon monoxide dehydrogenase small subunit (CoxS/CutS family)